MLGTTISGKALTYSQMEIVIAVLIDVVQTVFHGRREVHQSTQVFQVVMHRLKRYTICGFNSCCSEKRAVFR